MASDNINPIEKHVEKAVLGLCIIFLMYSIMHWMSSSHRTGKLPDGKVVGPREIDKELLGMANKIVDLNNNAPVEKRDIPDYVGAIEKMQNSPWERTKIQPIVAIGSPYQTPMEGTLIDPPEVAKFSKIRELVKKTKPHKPVVFSGYILPQPEEEEEFEFEEGQEVEESIPTPPKDIVVAHVVSSYPLNHLKDEFAKILTPTMFDIGNNLKIAIVAMEAQRSVILMDGTQLPDETIIPAEAVEEIPAWNGSNAEEIRMGIESFISDQTRQTEIFRPNYPSIWIGTQQAEKLKKEGKILEFGSNEWIVNKPYLEVPQGDAEMWFHDSSLQPKNTYKYRIRLTLLNPIHTYGEVMEDPKSGQVRTLTTLWSEWSDPVSTSRSKSFAMSAIDETNKLVKIKVTATFLGKQVTSKSFKTIAGQEIGGDESVEVRDPFRNVPVQADVSFDTGSVLVKVDFSSHEVLSVANPSSFVSKTRIIYLDGETGELKSQVYQR